MQRMSLGLIETVGLIAALEAADAAVKSANVELVGLELTKGGGMVVVKLQGDVGAINAAVQAGKAAAEAIGAVYSVKVIARPHQELDIIVQSGEKIELNKTSVSNREKSTVEMAEEETAIMSDESPAVQPEPEETETVEIPPETVEIPPETVEAPPEIVEIPSNPTASMKVPTCNLCHDARCPRKKGESRKHCINY